MNDMNDFATIGTIIVSVICGSIFLYVFVKELQKSSKRSQGASNDPEAQSSEELEAARQEPAHA